MSGTTPTTSSGDESKGRRSAGLLALLSLALVSEREGELVGFGDPRPMDRLRNCLNKVPVGLRSLRIEAIPADGVPGTGESEPAGSGVWWLVRPAHRFLVRVDGD